MPVASVRDMAKGLRVNPATVSKAYQRLTDAGVLEVRRGEGTYVAASPPALGRAERSRVLREGAARYAAAAMMLGAAREEALEELRLAWAELAGGRKGAER
jgi:GntR family transcriptional regulator